MAGLSILKHMHDLSDEDLCARWVENLYYQLFCGEEFFQHQLTFDRSSLTRWRQRMEEERLTALIQESLAVATRTGAAKPADFSKVIVDRTVQPKAIAFPTDAKLMHRARERLVRLAKKTGVELRQSTSGSANTRWRTQHSLKSNPLRRTSRVSMEREMESFLRMLRLGRRELRLVGARAKRQIRTTRCLVPSFDGAFLSSDSKDALWAKFYPGAPRRQRRSVERYRIVKRA
jgi:hypothetical protein